MQNTRGLSYLSLLQAHQPLLRTREVVEVPPHHQPISEDCEPERGLESRSGDFRRAAYAVLVVPTSTLAEDQVEQLGGVEDLFGSGHFDRCCCRKKSREVGELRREIGQCGSGQSGGHDRGV